MYLHTIFNMCISFCNKSTLLHTLQQMYIFFLINVIYDVRA